MPRYRLLTRHVIADVVREAGDIVEIDCAPSLDMEPLDKAGATALTAFRAKLADLRAIEPASHFQIRNGTWLEELLRGLRQ